MSSLGPLERRVIEVLWSRQDAACVRDLHSDFPEIAYTTLMTTLDRLHRKGVLDRMKLGRAFYYTPRVNSDELESMLAAEALRRALARDTSSIRPLLAFLVNALADRDNHLLDELEALVRARRAAKV